MRQSFSYTKRAILGALLVFAALLVSASAVFADHTTTYGGTDYARVYDYDYYTSHTHPELAGKGDAEVLKHFVTTGIKNGEQAIASFSVKSYRNANQDLRESYDKDYSKYISQYIKKGYAQNRTTLGYDSAIKDPVTSYGGKNYNRVYDFNYYMNRYPSLKKKYALDDFGAIKYFVTKGMAKKHQANENFNVTWYYNKWAVLRYLYGRTWSKYYTYYQKKGYRRGAVPPVTKLQSPITYYKNKGKKYDLSSIYDFEYYTRHNSSAYKYWKNQDDAGAIKNFVNYGMFVGLKAKEGVSSKSSTYLKLRKKIHPNLNSNAYIKANSYSSRTKYLMLINQAEHMVYVFKGKKGAWSCIKSFRCDVGKPSTPTPTGVFAIGGRGLYFDSNAARCWYFTQIRGTILFHSVLYFQDSSPARLMDGTMGASVSHGCVRLALSNAKWVYDTIPTGTTVVSYNRPF